MSSERGAPVGLLGRARRGSASPTVRTAVLLLIGLVPLACDAASPGTGEGGTVHRERVAGVEVVRNDALPAVDSLPVTAVWATMEPTWEEPLDVEAAAGRVYLLDRMASRVRVLDAADGRPLFAFGRDGQGPAEFQRAREIDAGDDEILVVDVGSAAVDRFGLEGAYLGTAKTGSLILNAASVRGDSILAFRVGSPAGEWVRMAADGEGEAPVGPARWRVEAASGDTMCVRSGVEADRLFQLACGEVAYRELDLAGAPLREVWARGAAPPVDAGRVDSALAVWEDAMHAEGVPTATVREVLERRRARFESGQHVRDLDVDRSTGWRVVLEQVPEELGWGSATAHVLDSTGVWLGRHRFERPWVDFEADGGRIYAVEVDLATGLRELVAYRLDLRR